MDVSPFASELASVGWSDERLVEHVRRGNTDAFALIMRRHNQRLFRVARAIVRDHEAEDVLQHAYMAAYAHLAQFRGTAKLSTWLTRIVINEALARLREERRQRTLRDDSEPDWRSGSSDVRSPEDHASTGELAGLLEQAIDSLPESYRVVLVLRELEGLSTIEAAECLSVSEESARVRLHRARAMLREGLRERLGAAAAEVFTFGAERCQRTVISVLARLAGQRS